jgi:hypothetical protein
VKHRNHQPWEIEVLYHVQQGLQAGTTYGFMAGLSLPEIELKIGLNRLENMSSLRIKSPDFVLGQ